MTRLPRTKKLSILGSTGSIGKSALNLVDLHPDRFQVITLAASKNSDLLYEQALRYHPRLVALSEPGAAEDLRKRLSGQIEVLSGADGVSQTAMHPDVDTVLAGISGAAGLIPTFQALLHGKDVALANKETLVMAGELIMELVRKERRNLLPVDSEHCGLHQCLRESPKNEIHRLVLTASGGPFFSWSKEQLAKVSVEQALNHPTWQMGPKITIDSATLMNKGLEVIEAHHLFGVAPHQISIVIHPQSTVHSMVEFVDGSVLAQMSITDMRSAILYAFSYPERWMSNLPRLDLSLLPILEFFPPDVEKFSCIRLAYQALRSGQTYPATLNAANEVAVDHFLRRMLPFASIPEVIEEVLNRHSPSAAADIETVLEADRQSRQATEEVVKNFALR